jgi:hypothetical protein
MMLLSLVIAGIIVYTSNPASFSFLRHGSGLVPVRLL